MIFDNLIEPLAEELRQYFERMISQLGSIAENTERQLAEEQQVTLHGRAVYDAAGNAVVEIATPLGSSLEIIKLSGVVESGFARAAYINAVSPAGQIHRWAGGAIIELGTIIYLKDGEKLLVSFEGGTPEASVYVNAQGKRYTENPGA